MSKFKAKQMQLFGSGALADAGAPTSMERFRGADTRPQEEPKQDCRKCAWAWHRQSARGQGWCFQFSQEQPNCGHYKPVT